MEDRGTSPLTEFSQPGWLNRLKVVKVCWMPDAVLTGADEKERLSYVYVRAVAARAGYMTSQPDVDRDSVDLRIQSGGAMRPALDLQLKATVNLRKANGGYFRFPLKVNNYEALRIETQTPRLLVVLDLPKDHDRWMTISTEELVLRRTAYWLHLQGYDETDNQSSVTVQIPKANHFNVENLRTLMEQSRSGQLT